MSHQGGMSHSNYNANNQNKNNHQSTRALELLPVGSSLTAGDLRFPDQVLGSNHASYRGSVNIVPNNDHSAAVFPHGSPEALRFSSLTSLTGNGRRFPHGLSGSSDLHYQASNSIIPSIGRSAGIAPPQNVDSGNNLNMSLSLSLHSYGPENQNTNNSYATGVDCGRSSSTMQEQGLDSSPVDIGRSCKRKSFEHTTGDLLVGESSNTAAQSGSSILRASEVYGNNGLNISSPCIGPVSHQEHSETIVGHGTIRAVPDSQHLNAARLSEILRSNIHHHAAENQQGFLPIGILSSGYLTNAHIQLPSQSSLHGQDNHSLFFRSAESSISSISSVQPDDHVPNSHETSQASPWLHMMRSSSGGISSFVPVYSAMESEVVAPFQQPRSMTESIMIGHQIGRRNWVHDARNSHFVNNGTANSHGDNFHSFHGFASDTTPPSANAPAWFPMFNFVEHFIQTPPRTMNHPVLATTSFPRHSNSPTDSDSLAVLQEMGFAVGFANSVSLNQHTSEARPENHATSNFTWPLANDQNRMRLLPENLHTSEARAENEDYSYDRLFQSFWSPDNAANRRRLSLELHHLLTQLHNVIGDPSMPMTVPEELRRLDHSVMMDVLVAHGYPRGEARSLVYEIAAEPVHIPDMGLSEEMILIHLRQEKFQPNPNGSGENGCCCICQDEYEENEDLGKLCCDHKFHVECIKSWLEQKNLCPICKQIALPVFL